MQQAPSDDLPLKLRPSYRTQFIQESREYPAGITAYRTKRGVGKSLYHWFRKLKPFHPECNDLGKDRQHHEKRAESRALFLRIWFESQLLRLQLVFLSQGLLAKFVIGYGAIVIVVTVVGI